MSESYYIRRKVAAARERGRRMAKRRWQLDHERRDKLAALTAEQYPAQILRRIIVIEQERTVKEAVIWSFDSARSARRKIQSILYGPPQKTEPDLLQSPLPTARIPGQKEGEFSR